MNAMHMLIQGQPHIVEGGGFAKSEQQVSFPVEQQFGEVMAQFLGQANPNFAVQPEEGMPALQFEMNLAEIFAILSGATDQNTGLEDETEGLLSFFPNVVSEEQDFWETNDLIAYLQAFIQEMEQDHVSAEALFTFFTAIPELPVELATSQQSGATLADETLLGNRQISLEQEPGHWTRWNQLLAHYKQMLKNEPIEQETMNQVKHTLLSLANRWKENQEWLALLREEIGRETSRNQALLVQSTPKIEKPNFTTYLPLSLLNKVSQEGALEHKQSGQQVQINPLANKENSATGNSLSSLVSATDGREFVQEIQGRLASAPKAPEATPTASARFSHLLEDMQGIFRKQISLLKDGDTAQLRVRLTPEHLGHLDIRISSENGKVIAQIITSNRMAKDALDLQLHQLRATLTQQGIQVERMEVSQNTNSHNLLQQDQKHSQHFQQQQGQKGTAKQADYAEVDELENNEGVFYDQESQVNYAV